MKQNIEIDFWQRFDRVFGERERGYGDLLDALRKTAKAYFQAYQKCLISGSEVDFERFVEPEQLQATCQDIWDHPDKYSDYLPNSEAAYYEFLKFLWVTYPDGKTKQLAEIVLRNKRGDYGKNQD